MWLYNVIKVVNSEKKLIFTLRDFIYTLDPYYMKFFIKPYSCTMFLLIKTHLLKLK